MRIETDHLYIDGSCVLCGASLYRPDVSPTTVATTAGPNVQ